MLVGVVKRPADLGECQRVRVGKVTILPAWLEFLFEIEEREILARIAKTVRHEVNARPQEGVIGAIDMALRSKAQAHDVGSLLFQVFYRAC